MARPKEVIDATLAEKAESALKGLSYSKVCVRLKAIASSARYPISLIERYSGSQTLLGDRMTGILISSPQCACRTVLSFSLPPAFSRP